MEANDMSWNADIAIGEKVTDGINKVNFDCIKQATVNSLANIIFNSHYDSSDTEDINPYNICRCIYKCNEDGNYYWCTFDSTNSLEDTYMPFTNPGQPETACITMANLPYAISWLRNPERVGASTDTLALIPNDVSVLNQSGSMSNGGLNPYSAGCLSIVDGSNDDYCIKLCNSGYSREDVTKSIRKATCTFNSSTATFTVNTGYVGTALTCELTKSSLTGDIVLTPSTPSVTISPGYTGGGTVKMSTCNLICSRYDNPGSNYIVISNYRLNGQCRYLLTGSYDVDVNIVIYLNGYRINVTDIDDPYIKSVYFDSFPNTWTPGYSIDLTNSISSYQCHYFCNYGDHTLDVHIYSSSNFSYYFYSMDGVSSS